MSEKPKYANDCKWCDLKTGLCGNPNKYRGKKTQIIAGQEVDVTWNGRCLSEDTVAGLAVGSIHPPLACDEAEAKNGGNGAKMREALEDAKKSAFEIIEVLRTPCRVNLATNIANYITGVCSRALAAPGKNCERFQTWDEAKDAYWREQGDPCDWRKLGAWLFAPEGGAK